MNTKKTAQSSKNEKVSKTLDNSIFSFRNALYKHLCGTSWVLKVFLYVLHC